MRLTFGILFEWSSLYVRVSREILMPTLHEVTTFGPFTTVLANTSLNMGRFKLRVEQYAQVIPPIPVPDVYQGAVPPRPPPKGLPSTAAEPDPTPSVMGSQKARNMAYLQKVAGFAELEATKLYSQVRLVLQWRTFLLKTRC